MPETPFEPQLPSLILDDDVSDARSFQSRTRNSNASWIAAIVVLVVIAAAAYWWWQKQASPASSPVAPAATEAPPAPAKAEPAIRHPIDDARGGVAAPDDERKPLPAISESDTAIRAALAGIWGDFDRLFYPQEMVRRIVATVDNLPRKSVAPQVMAAKPVPGAFVAAGMDNNLAISADNSARYAPYVRLAHALDTKTLVAFYVRFYPWFQQAYQDLGYPNGYFNDRLIDVIDNLLATPEAPAPVALVQPHVLYEYADPGLEALSAGQKIMLRMGTNNAAQVRAKLRELRGLLTGLKAGLPATPPG